jgi:uncharacterized protein (DUF433 family)
MNKYYDVADDIDCDDMFPPGLARAERRGPWIWRQPSVLSTPKNPSSFSRAIGEIANQCCLEHPMVSLENTIFGGMPHIRGVRVSVSDILIQVYLLGSLHAVVEYYSSEISIDQVRDAVAYAQDFLETALAAT